MQRLPDAPASEWRKSLEYFVSINGQPHVHGTAEFVRLSDNTEAFITTSEDKSRSMISWLRGDTKLIVRGPNLDRTSVIRIADQIVQEPIYRIEGK
jgi:hypothetical protein